MFSVFDDVNDQWAAFKVLVGNVINEFAPIKTFRTIKVDNLPWIDRECHYLLKKRDSLHRKAIAFGYTPECWKDFKEARNRRKSFIANKKKYNLDAKILTEPESTV